MSCLDRLLLYQTQMRSTRTYFSLMVAFTVLFVCIMLLTVHHGGHVHVRHLNGGHINIRVATTPGYTSYLSPKLVNGSSPVLIITYMRSGSTLTGDILQRHPSNFYVFEPLRFIDDDIDKGESIIFLNESSRTIRKQQKTRIHAEMVYRWLTCDFHYINLRDLTSLFLGSFSWKAKHYFMCMRRHRSTVTAVRTCLYLLVKPCVTSELRIVKTIRLRMPSVALLLEWLPNLKVIYLIRDPRGKLSSQISAYHQDWENVTSLFRDTCRQMLSDIHIATELKRQYPKRIRVLMYEKMASLPVETSERIFQFLNTTLTYGIMLSVRDMTSGLQGSRSNCTWCSKKGNSRSIAYRWRTQANLLYLDMMDRYCSDVYREAGYVRFNNIKDIRNLDIPMIEHARFTEDAL